MTAKETIYFNKYKDKSIVNINVFRRLLGNVKDVKVYEIYREIVNYQVRTYGETLNGNRINKHNVEEVNANAKQRKIYKRKYWGLEKERGKKNA